MTNILYFTAKQGQKCKIFNITTSR